VAKGKSSACVRDEKSGHLLESQHQARQCKSQCYGWGTHKRGKKTQKSENKGKKVQSWREKKAVHRIIHEAGKQPKEGS